MFISPEGFVCASLEEGEKDEGTRVTEMKRDDVRIAEDGYIEALVSRSVTGISRNECVSQKGSRRASERFFVRAIFTSRSLQQLVVEDWRTSRRGENAHSTRLSSPSLFPRSLLFSPCFFRDRPCLRSSSPSRTTKLPSRSVFSW